METAMNNLWGTHFQEGQWVASGVKGGPNQPMLRPHSRKTHILVFWRWFSFGAWVHLQERQAAGSLKKPRLRALQENQLLFHPEALLIFDCLLFIRRLCSLHSSLLIMLIGAIHQPFLHYTQQSYHDKFQNTAMNNNHYIAFVAKVTIKSSSRTKFLSRKDILDNFDLDIFQ